MKALVGSGSDCCLQRETNPKPLVSRFGLLNLAGVSAGSHVRESRGRAKTGWLREFAPESKKALAFLAVCAGVTVECGVDWCKLCKAFSALVHHAPASGQRASAAALQRRPQSSPELTPPRETISDQLRQYTTALASLAPAPKNCDVECRVRRFRENRAATDAYKIR